MSIETRRHARQFSVALLSLSAIALYLFLISAQYSAARLSGSTRERNLVWAARLDPFNAEFRNNIGRFQLLVRQSPSSAIPWLQTATALNPNHAAYWLDSAVAQELAGDFASEQKSLASTVAADPRSAAIAWEVANRYLAAGSVNEALREYRRVMENDPHLAPQAIQICWRVRPDIEGLLRSVIPVNVNQPFLSFLISEDQPQAAARVWERIASLREPIRRQLLFEYLRYLFAEHDGLQARRVWQQAAAVSGLAAYQPSDDNLLVDGDFSLDVLNGGFDWTYHKTPGVSLALDPINGYSGARSLRIFFEGPGIVDAGIQQIVSVEPNTQYQFSAYYKAEEMEGAGGARFAIQDAYSDSNFFLSEDLHDAEYWTQVNGAFMTKADTHLVTVRILRVPGGSPIRGRLWIDDLKLVTTSGVDSLQKDHS